MDLATQGRVLELTGEGNGDLPIVLLGAPDPESAELSALTVTSGDPTFAGPLAGVQLGLPVYHILEADIEEAADAGAYEEHVAIMKMALDAEGVAAAVSKVRNAAASG